MRPLHRYRDERRGRSGAPVIIPGLTLTPGLAAMLASRNDDGTPPLHIVRLPSTEAVPAGSVTPAVPALDVGVAVYRSDGSELSETEQRHVRATLADAKAPE